MKQTNTFIKLFAPKSKLLFKKYRSEVKDIILFGSQMRGKTISNDIDILILFRQKINKDIEYELKNLLQTAKSDSSSNISIISKTQDTLVEESFDAREGILFEGFSLVRSKLIASDFGFMPYGLFIYNTKPLSNTDKTRFYYALNGRDSLKLKGMVIEHNLIKLSDNSILAPLHEIEPAKQFFEYWKMEYRYVPILLPQRMGKASIIGKHV